MNLDYKELKAKWTGHKPQIFIACALVRMFIAGYGVGKGRSSFFGNQQGINYNNYTTNKLVAPAPKNIPTDLENCMVRGNINAQSGNKTYHIKGGRFYATVKPEQCFDTEDQAKAAGFKKSPS